MDSSRVTSCHAQFKVTQFQCYSVFKQINNQTGNIFEMRSGFYLVGMKAQSDLQYIAEECHRTTHLTSVEPFCGRSDSSVLEYRFQLYSSVYNLLTNTD
jgi:hypothetical protein